MRTCKVEGCKGKYKAKGYCDKHYQRFKKYGDPFFVIKKLEMHGMTHTLEYRTWHSMLQRCYNSKIDSYSYYGGRGITVCDRWKNSFTAFYKDMNVRPFLKAQIDRIDSNGNYEPSNCRWVTPAQNAHNRNATKLTWEKVRGIRKIGHSLSYTNLGEIYGVNYRTITDVINNKTWREV